MSIDNAIDQSVHLVNRTSLELTGVIDVSTFTESVIEAEYNGGCIAIEGTELKILDFSSQSGILKVFGNVNSLYYFGKSKKSKKALFRK